jgi:hypothetical protein
LVVGYSLTQSIENQALTEEVENPDRRFLENTFRELANSAAPSLIRRSFRLSWKSSAGRKSKRTKFLGFFHFVYFVGARS